MLKNYGVKNLDKAQSRRFNRKYQYYLKILSDEKIGKSERIRALEIINMLVYIKTGIDVTLKYMKRGFY